MSNLLNTANSRCLEITPGRTGGTYACRGLVIAYAAWISAEFHLKVIRVKGLLPFEEAKKRIMDDQRQKFIDDYRTSELVKINDDPKTVLNEEAIDALYIAPPSAETLRQLTSDAMERSKEKSNEKKSDK